MLARQHFRFPGPVPRYVLVYVLVLCQESIAVIQSRGLSKPDEFNRVAGVARAGSPRRAQQQRVGLGQHGEQRAVLAREGRAAPAARRRARRGRACSARAARSARARAPSRAGERAGRSPGRPSMRSTAARRKSRPQTMAETGLPGSPTSGTPPQPARPSAACPGAWRPGRSRARGRGRARSAARGRSRRPRRRRASRSGRRPRRGRSTAARLSAVSRAIGSSRASAPAASSIALSPKLFEETIWSGPGASPGMTSSSPVGISATTGPAGHRDPAGVHRGEEREVGRAAAAAGRRRARRRRSRRRRGGCGCRASRLGAQRDRVAVALGVLLDHDHVGAVGHGRAGEDAHRLAGADRAVEARARRSRRRRRASRAPAAASAARTA